METVLPRRRKSQGSIRSPVVKRDSQSQVVLEGWLYKLEGGALRQWKNRWCVLADFCLFFYKGQDEDKVFSSVLLPSYKISLCSSEDKISRKFAFKAEHQNMKTYYFAAENKEIMNRWMNAMSLACIMQKFVRGDKFASSYLKNTANNDDEDSGFTSYHSRRYGTQDPNSTFDSSFNSEPLNQRSSSYGDRVGEMLLGSDDKYPNVYESNQSHLYKALSVDSDVPLRQPLYANAPPKPRRLTQSDSYAIAPSEQYGSMGYDNLAPDLSNSHYPSSVNYPSQYPLSHHMNTDIPQEVPSTCYDMYSPHSTSLEHSYEPQSVSKVMEQPPRPHSADFLERDTDCHSVTHRNVGFKTQPQRPKSSLECYDRFWEAEECGFEDYREAVRSQADSLYMNRKTQQSELRTDKRQKEISANSVQRKNVYNNSSSSVLVDRNDSEMEPRDYNENECKPNIHPVLDKCLSSKQESHFSPDNKSKTHEESMRRLIEWKQRMLQSPLTKRSQEHSGTSSSAGRPPSRPPLPSEYRQQVLQELESHEARLRMHENEVPRGRSKSWHDPNGQSSFLHTFHESQSYESKGNSFDLGKYDTADACPLIRDSNNVAMKNESESETLSGINRIGDDQWNKADNEKVMYCVDSENNEILISYKAEDSPVASSVPFIVDNNYINKEQELSKSLSTNEILASAYPHQGKKTLVKYGAERDLSESVDSTSTTHQTSKNVVKFQCAAPTTHPPHHYNTSYSSDDEDGNVKEDSHSRRFILFKPEGDKEDKTIEANKENSEVSPTPDYVNISFVNKKWKKNHVKEACIKSIPAENDLSCLGRDEVDRNEKAMRNDLSFYDSQDEVFHSIPDDFKTDLASRKLDSCHNSMSHAVYEEEKQLDIKREDYYRASQLFYSLPQSKNEKSPIPLSADKGQMKKESSIMSRNLPTPNSARHAGETYDSRYRKNIIKPGSWNLDKDVGLPLPVLSGKVHHKRYSELSLDHIKLQSHQMDVSSNSHETFPQVQENSVVSEGKDNYSSGIEQTGYSIKDAECSKDSCNSSFEKCSFISEKEKWKNPASFANLMSSKKNVSSEEMRLLLRQQREAPPPNIVQERIKRFESVENNSNVKIDKGDVSSAAGQNDFPKPKLEENFDHRESGQMRCDITRKKIRHKTSHYQKFQRWNMHSDSEAVWPRESDDSLSDDSLTMKSAPILLSPLSSVLADLRKTADTGKEKAKPSSRASASGSINSENVFPTHEAQEVRMNEEACDPCAITDRLSLMSKSFHSPEFQISKRKLDFEEEAYLPMSGLKTSEEPEYVAMDDSRLGLSRTSHEVITKKVSTEDEPLYNEPYVPPPSFLHDVYEKQKMKHIPFESDSSSSDELSENIYEKPKHVSSVLEYNKVHKSMSRENVGNKPNVFLSNNLRTLAGNNPDHPSGRVSVPCDYESLSENAQQQYNYPTIQSHSVPDLLQLQEIKHSDASDADDEASRDFDMSVNLPSYQCDVFDQFPRAVDGSTSYAHHKYPSFDSEMSFSSKQISDCHGRGTQHSHFPPPYNHTSLTGEVVEPQPTPNSLSKESTNNLTYHPQENAQQVFVEDEKQIHFRKLRVYTKGKKPEAPKIYPVPFNLEESDLHPSSISQNKCDVTDTCQGNALAVDVVKVGDKTHISNYNNSIFMDENNSNSFDCSNLNRSLTGNVPFMTSHSSLAPDVVPSDLIEEKFKDQKSIQSPCRSPSSAPYYYSDLHPEDTHMFSLSRSETSDFRRSASPKSTCAVLNNVRDKSPSYASKGDIGKKVNKINNRKHSYEGRDMCSENSLKFPKEIPVDLKSDFKHTIEKFNCSESKYLDAERNKYEAGHTLDKTRRACSSLAFFRQGASTPDLKSPLNLSSEPVYENIARESTHLVRQRSCSLEGLSTNTEFHRAGSLTVPETCVTHNIVDGKTSPIYENIEFTNHTSSDLPADSSSTSRHVVQSPSSAPYFEENSASNSFLDNMSVPCHPQYADETSDLAYSSQPEPDQMIFPVSSQDIEISAKSGKDTDEETNFLGQYELRRVSEQHFFGKLYNNNYHSKLCHPSDHYEKHSPCASSLIEKNQHTSRKPFLKESQTGQDKVLENHIGIHNKVDSPDGDLAEATIRQDDEADSSSLSSSSGDEASGDSEYRSKRSNLRTKSSLYRTLNNVSDSEIQVREPNQLRKLVQHSEGLTSKGKRLSISAGDLLGKTHEELVLLLIQLRRNQSRISRAKEKCQHQLQNEQQILKSEKSTEQVCSQNASELMKQISQLEKQYEVTRPLVNLVDNMVKLGSLYGTTDNGNSFSLVNTADEAIPVPHYQISEKLHESSTWSAFCQEENDLRGHLNEIYNLDKGLRQESHSFSSLQQDKEMLEFTLNGMKSKILDHQDKPIELQRLRKQQKMIEKELSRVKRLLTHSAKKIEEATNKNDQLEQEILSLRQKIQQALNTGSCEMETCLQSRADLEAELTRVQNVLEELANHRQEINNTVEKLRSEAHLKVSLNSTEVRASPTGVAGSAPLPLRKKQQSSYLETDLDTMVTRDLSTVVLGRDLDDIPVYVNAEEITGNQGKPPNETDCPPEYPPPPLPQSSSTVDSSQCSLQDINDADDRMKRFYGILPREKSSEIKTVRIVKRQSERRSRERDKKRVTYDEQSLVWVSEEPDISSDDFIEAEDDSFRKTMMPLASSSGRPTSIPLPQDNVYKPSSAHERLFGRSTEKTGKGSDTHDSSDSRSPTKRWKRRHYTVSGYQCMFDPQFSPSSQERPRSRDDVDMERCLRTANTPDIVRSTIKKKEVFDEKIIDRELGLPQKIVIPERYIEDEPEQLSASERLRRSLKAENIRKMLSETTTIEDISEGTGEQPEKIHRKLSEEKRKRAHLLALNHALAREVMERSKVVAANVYGTENQASS